MTGGGTIENLSVWILPGFILLILFVSFIKKVNSYEVFIIGVKDGLNLIGSIMPSLMAMILMVNLIRESHLFDLIHIPFINLPSELLAMCIFRPISGGASLAMMVNIFQLYGPDSLFGLMASVIQGSTDTTIYVLALYFSSVGIKKIRNAMWIGLFADVVGISTAIFLSMLFF